ncbi:capsular polysaccharide export protein, LipB/KpsS family [Halomonas litopenaei]|uniref:capsular polysaccharide export protein, LipB/KpsS family n=1 Tax=Halomonas litopenaei TaxID=2109328 RepID=UPI003FA06A2B
MKFVASKKILKRWKLEEFIRSVAPLERVDEADAIITDSCEDRVSVQYSKDLGLPLYIVEAGPLAPYTVKHLRIKENLSIRLTPVGNAQELFNHVDSVKEFLNSWSQGDVSWVNDTPPLKERLPVDYDLIVVDEKDIERYGTVRDVLKDILEIRDRKIKRSTVVYLPVWCLDEALHNWVRGKLDTNDVVFVGNDIHVSAIMHAAHSVWVHSSVLALDARLKGKDCYAVSQHLSDDVLDDAIRYFERGCFYRHPESASPTSLQSVIDWILSQRRQRFAFIGEMYALGFTRWKFPVLHNYFQGAQVYRIAAGNRKSIPAGSTLVVWGSKPLHEYPGGEALNENDYKLVRLEDAFIRSIGLGAKLARPLSWVIDDRGIYYDARKPSALEVFLNTAEFSSSDERRANALSQRVIKDQVTKYNVGASAWLRPEVNGPIILVPGQVESDASIRYGAGDIRTNLDLLKRVRLENPDAYILYKPHPDVLANFREEGKGEKDASHYCDEILTDVIMAQLLDCVDEVHVMTSLAGFEALIRRKRVVVYGSPFYAGWGLTEDKQSHPRRSRKLGLDQLVAGALIYYPTYVSLKTGLYMSPEEALDQLVDWRENGTYNSSKVKTFLVFLRRKILNILRR